MSFKQDFSVSYDTLQKESLDYVSKQCWRIQDVAISKTPCEHDIKIALYEHLINVVDAYPSSYCGQATSESNVIDAAIRNAAIKIMQDISNNYESKSFIDRSWFIRPEPCTRRGE